MTVQHILQLGQMLGLSCTELNANGDEQALPTTLITQALTDFGFTDELDVKLEEEIKQFWLRALPPVIVMDESAEIQFDLHLPIEFVTEDLIWEIRSNQTVIETAEFTPVEWSLNGIYHLHDMEMQSYQISFTQPLAVGAYQFVILDQGSEEPLGESWIINSPATLTPTSASSTTITVLPTTEAVLNQLLTYAQPGLAVVAMSDSESAEIVSAQFAQLQQQFNNDKAQTEFALTLKTVIAGAALQQSHLAQYLTAYTADGVTASRQETQTLEWQDAHSDDYEFYLWLVVTANNALTGKSLLRDIDFAIDVANAGSFAQWLLADYQLAHCLLDNSLLDNSQLDNVSASSTATGINSYQLRQDGYAAFRTLVDFTTMQSAGIVLNQPLSIMQQWLTIGDAGIWQNHEFNELLSIILLSCERHACACYYQADAELPEELTAYLDARGLQQLPL